MTQKNCACVIGFFLLLWMAVIRGGGVICGSGVMCGFKKRNWLWKVWGFERRKLDMICGNFFLSS